MDGEEENEEAAGRTEEKECITYHHIIRVFSQSSFYVAQGSDSN